MKHLVEDYGVTAFIATLVIVGAFALLWRVADRVNPETLMALVGGWISGIVTGFVMIKINKKPKE